MTTDPRLTAARRRTTGLGIAWLALGVPIGGFVGWLLQISDTAQDRQFGYFLLGLAALSLVLGTALLRRGGSRLLVASFAGSGLWVVAAGLAVVLADFPTDRLWGGGLTGLVAVATAALAAPVGRR